MERAKSINPFEHGDVYTTLMYAEPFKQALRDSGYDVIFGSARRDEEATRAEERSVSVRSGIQSWEPRSQRPELWRRFNWRWVPGEMIRAYPISHSTEHDLWQWILRRGADQTPLNFARERPVVMCEGLCIVVDDPLRMRWLPGEQDRLEDMRFRTLGRWPVTRAEASGATTLATGVQVTEGALTSDRTGCIGNGRLLERQKGEGHL